jgi:hypothetical protein
MPITLANAKELSQEKLTNFVIDEFRKSALLDSLVFDNTVKPQGGQSMTYSYNRVTTQPTAAGRAINSEYTPQETITTRYNVDLKVFGGSFELDRVIIKHETQVVQHVQFQLEQKIKATRALFHDLFINGDADDDALAFDGLDVALTGSSTEYEPASPIDLSSSANITNNWMVFLDNLRRMRALLDGAPTLYLMNGDMYSVFQSVMDRAGINLLSKENFGFEVSQWGPSLVMSLGDKPGTTNPIIPTVNGATSIYAARIGLDGVHGVSPEGSSLVETYLPTLTDPGAVKLGEVEMVAAVAIKATRSAGVLRDVVIGDTEASE